MIRDCVFAVDASPPFPPTCLSVQTATAKALTEQSHRRALPSIFRVDLSELRLVQCDEEGERVCVCVCAKAVWQAAAAQSMLQAVQQHAAREARKKERRAACDGESGCRMTCMRANDVH